jgi:uncharacterized protein
MALTSAGVLLAQDLPRVRGYVNDYANVIPTEDERAIEQIATAVDQQTGAQIAVLTVDSMAPYGSIEQYAIAVAEEWGIGDPDQDTGLLFVVSVGDRQLRLEVGYGLEGAIPDGRAGDILDTYVVPDLRNNDYGAGLRNGVAAVAPIIAEEFGVTLSSVEQPVTSAPARSGPDFGDLFYIVFVLIFAGGRWFFWPLLFSRRRRGFFGGGFGSHGRGGGFSSGGGFGGFSGGGFGGGGASRGF